MKISKWFYLSVLLPFSVTAVELPAPATEVQIFRNGTALIRHQVNAGSAADFTVSGNFSPLAGTIWSTPNVKEIRKTISEISKEEAVPLSDITETYKNQFVTLYVNSGINKLETVKGTVIDLNKKEKNANSPYVRNSYVTLKCTKEGKIRIIAIPSHQIVRVESDALKIAQRTVKEEKQAWAFSLIPGSKGEVTFDYAAKVLNWTPSFKLMLLPEKKFLLTGNATVVNTGDELKNVKCTLWAGAPNIENSNRFSPMAIVKQAIPRPPQPRAAYDGRSRMYKNAPMVMAERAAGSAAPAEAGIVGNMAPFDSGRLSLKKGEALVRTLWSAKGSYENLARWRIPARQGDNGSHIWKNNMDVTGNIWECLRFVNPFKHPIPDGAVEICDGSSLIAQIKGTWVNSGESATWEITPCRDVKATFVEQEAPSSIKDRGKKLFQKVDWGSDKSSKVSSFRENSSKGGSVKGGYYNGSWYRITDIKGRMQLKNFRKAPVRLTIEMDYFGEFVSADGKPEKKALNHFGSLNPKNQMVWNIVLKPGEERKLDFRYNIIINR